jgi:hypothetical protein
MRKLEKTSLTFSGRDWVRLTDAFLQVMSNVGQRDLARNLFKRDLLSGRLGSMKILPDGTITLLNLSNWQQLTLTVPLRPQEGVGVQPHVDGYIYVRRADLDKHYPIAATPAPTTAAQADDAQPPKPRRKPGPPAKGDWPEQVMREVISRALRAGYKLPNAPEMQEWCENTLGFEPDMRQMQRFLRDLRTPKKFSPK